MAQIRRVVVHPGGEVRTESTSLPSVGFGEAKVRSVLVGVCGSDTHAQAGRHPHINLPYAPGHEVVGVIDEVGPAVSGYAPGQRVVVEPTLPCWQCKPCRNGLENLCENLDFFGCGNAQGGMAEAFTIPVNRLHVIPDSLDDRTAALIEPLSTPVHAARIAGPLQGRAVVVIGAGTIGLLMTLVAVREGAKRVVVTDPLPAKRALAEQVGADAVVDATASDATALIRETLGESADVVFDCVAIQSTVLQALQLARKGGVVATVGVPSADVTVPLPTLQDEQIRLQGSATYTPEDVRRSIILLEHGLVDPDLFLTGVFPLEEAQGAFAAAMDGGHIKVVVRVNPAPLPRADGGTRHGTQ